MTAQDADETETTAAEDSMEETEDGGESATEALSEIAETPEESVDEVLDAIIEESDSPNGGGDADESASDGQSVASDGTTTRVTPEDVTISESFVEELESTSTETIAQAITLLREELSRVEAELETTREEAEDFESRLKRKQADFQNYKKRQKEKLAEEKQRATEDLVERLLAVRDNLARALDQDEDADIRGGVESTLEQFDQQLERENVEPIEPEPGQTTDPTRHEVLATVDSDQPEDTIAHVHRPGYEMAGKVLRPAQVTISDGTADGDGDGTEDGDEN
jgi:molecular chaperone GrpE